MKKRIISICSVFLIIVCVLAQPFEALATEGTLGYQGGISIENKLKKDEYQYSEFCFITGRPILLTGTLTIKKTEKGDVITATYTYKLSNVEYNAVMNRVVMYTTTKETKTNGQITESTQMSRVPTEVITIGGTSYRLTNSSFSRAVITDPKPGINYQTGEFTCKNTYAIGAGGLNSDTITVTQSGRLYSYDQYWSSTQTQKIDVLVEADLKSTNPPIQWGGTAQIVASSATRKQIDYAENEPTHISFEGGHVQSKWTESILDYTATFPEFDKDGIPTDILVTTFDTQSLISQPELSRLMVPDLKHLNGFWAQEQIGILFGLEVIPGNGSSFTPEKTLTRREFVGMIMRALKEIPKDPNVRTATTIVKKTTSKTPEVSPYRDVNPGELYYEEIKLAHSKGIIQGDGKGSFYPNNPITQADAVKIIVAALGLENLAPYPTTTTPFADNDLIPGYARNSAAVAQTLGIITPDDRGNFNPNQKLTNENATDLMYNLIIYMGDELIKDYRDRMAEF